MHQADVVPDGSARALEARPCILAGLTYRRRQHVGDGRLFAGGARLHADARHGWHGSDRFGELAEIDLDMCTVVADRYQPLKPALVIDAAGDSDRLMRRAEMGVAANLDGDVAAQTTELCKVIALCGFVELPPHMQLGGAFGGAAAAFHHQSRIAKVLNQVIELGADVACVEIDNDGLHLTNVGSFGLTALGNGAGDDIDRRALARSPRRKRDHLVGHGSVSRNPDVVGLAVEALALVDEAPHRHKALAIAEDHIEKRGDLSAIRLCAEGVLLWRGIVEVAPGVEVDDVVVTHAGNAQQRFAHAHRRHSWKSRSRVMRGRSSPASVACRIRTARSLMRCARAASNGTNSWWSSAVSLLIAVNTAGLVAMPGTAASMYA
jgi:hypothetical protein